MRFLVRAAGDASTLVTVRRGTSDKSAEKGKAKRSYSGCGVSRCLSDLPMELPRRQLVPEGDTEVAGSPDM